jgi:hypothetical protein
MRKKWIKYRNFALQIKKVLNSVFKYVNAHQKEGSVHYT